MLTKYELGSKIYLAHLDRKATDQKGLCDRWIRLSASEQKEIFGAYIFGKKSIWIDSNCQRIVTSKKVCFGLDYEQVNYTTQEVVDIITQRTIAR